MPFALQNRLSFQYMYCQLAHRYLKRLVFACTFNSPPGRLDKKRERNFHIPFSIFHKFNKTKNTPPLFTCWTAPVCVSSVFCGKFDQNNAKELGLGSFAKCDHGPIKPKRHRAKIVSARLCFQGFKTKSKNRQRWRSKHSIPRLINLPRDPIFH